MLSLFTWLSFIFFIHPAHAAGSSCLELTDRFCDQLYSPSNLGNMGSIKLGRNASDMAYSRFFFLKAIESEFKNFKPDMKNALTKTHLHGLVKKLIHRKDLSQVKIGEIYNDEWVSEFTDALAQAFYQLANERTAKEIPGYLNSRLFDTDPAWDRQQRKQLDIVWAEFFQTIWQKNPAWLKVKKKFEVIRQDYVRWVEDDVTLTPEDKKFRLTQLKALELVIPGSRPESRDSDIPRCGIDQKNAFYENRFHNITVCAGEFTTADPTLILAHEIGHSIGNHHRLSEYLENSDYGKIFSKLWNQKKDQPFPTCNQWSQIKLDIQKSLSQLAPYVYHDEKLQSRFITHELRDRFNPIELRAEGLRLAKRSLRQEIDGDYIENLIKKESVLRSGRKLPNKFYLLPKEFRRWPIFTVSLESPNEQFDYFFANEFNCLANEKKLSDTDALKQALLEARMLTSQVWQMFLTVGGKLSPVPEAIEDELSQAVEEDVVDSYASVITSRLYGRLATVDERREAFLNGIATMCDPISFTRIYPDEATLLHQFSNEPHSVGRDRRWKLLTPEVKAVLQCD